MTIKRTSREFRKTWLVKNSHLKILDLGCSNVNYWEEANQFADIFDYKEEFDKKNLNYTKIEVGKKLPFKDKEFDYVILSHVLEHVPDIIEFKLEIERIAKSGYIELPTKLADNLVFDFVEERFSHKWLMKFDDVNQNLIYSKKTNYLQQFVSVGLLNYLKNFFDDSFTLQLYWKDSIDLKEEQLLNTDTKISFFDIQRKYYSRKIRSVKSKLKFFFKV